MSIKNDYFLKNTKLAITSTLNFFKALIGQAIKLISLGNKKKERKNNIFIMN